MKIVDIQPRVFFKGGKKNVKHCDFIWQLVVPFYLITLFVRI